MAEAARVDRHSLTVPSPRGGGQFDESQPALPRRPIERCGAAGHLRQTRGPSPQHERQWNGLGQAARDLIGSCEPSMRQVKSRSACLSEAWFHSREAGTNGQRAADQVRWRPKRPSVRARAVIPMGRRSLAEPPAVSIERGGHVKVTGASPMNRESSRLPSAGERLPPPFRPATWPAPYGRLRQCQQVERPDVGSQSEQESMYTLHPGTPTVDGILRTRKAARLSSAGLRGVGTSLSMCGRPSRRPDCYRP